MSVTSDQFLALVDAIDRAPSLEVLAELRGIAAREHGLDVRGGFLAVLIELRWERLERQRRQASRIA